MKLALFQIKNNKLNFKELDFNRDLEYYGLNTFIFFKNQLDLEDITDEDCDRLTFLASSFDDDEETKEEVISILEKYDYTLEDLGEPCLFIEDKPVISLEDFVKNEVRVEIDGDYDTWYWKPLNAVSEKELELIFKDEATYIAPEDLDEMGVDQDTYYLLKKMKKINDYADSLGFLNINQLINQGDIEVFDTEDEAMNYLDEQGYGFDYVEFYGKYYCFKR